MDVVLGDAGGLEADQAEGQVRPRVLVVEDDPALRLLLERMLGAVAEVHCVGSGKRAMALLAQLQAVDLVISDLNLGDMSALELLSQLEARGQRWRDRFIICTGGSICGAQAERMALSDIPVLRKPFRAKVLRDMVRRVTAPELLTLT